jgi:hypothetical protein
MLYDYKTRDVKHDKMIKSCVSRKIRCFIGLVSFPYGGCIGTPNPASLYHEDGRRRRPKHVGVVNKQS